MSDDIVSDHAVVRYLERVYGVDVKSIRKRIADATEDARKAGASAKISNGVRYCLSPSGKVTTITGPDAPMTNRGRRWKRKHK